MKVLRLLSLFLLSIGFVATAQAQFVGSFPGPVRSTCPIGVNINTSVSNFYGALDVHGDNIFLTRSQNIQPPSFPGRFLGMGESGGVPGAVNGCDLYGYRAQTSTNTFINMGIRRPNSGGGFARLPKPVITWGSADQLIDRLPGGGLAIVTRPKPLQFLFDEADENCGVVVAEMFAPSESFQFRVLGDALASGGVFQDSDKRFKREIEPIADAMETLNQINGYTYQFRTEEFPDRNFNEGEHYGFIA